MSRVGSQARTLAVLLGGLRPYWQRDPGLASRIDAALNDRRFGSRDRRLYRELLYTALRYLPWIEPFLDGDPQEAVRRIAWLAAEVPAVSAFRSEIAAGLPPCPESTREKAAILGADPQVLLPAWLREECPGAFEPAALDCLLSRAPLWVRLQTEDPAPVLEEFAAKGWSFRESPLLPGALRLPAEADIAQTQAFLSGRVEIQDIGSQRILGTAGIEAGGSWLDACAGAGGKSLQLVRLLGPSGSVVARDVRFAPLAQLRARAERAGLGKRIRIGVPSDPLGGYDGVLVDAPCSGTGTWRRAPQLKWATDAGAPGRFATEQLALLQAAAARVRPGGRLIYATCSLCRSENEAVVERFLRAVPGARLERPPRDFAPWEHDGDGFFAAYLRIG